LALEPRPPGVAKLANFDLWRLRVGDLRLIYAIDDAARVVIILRAARRNEGSYRLR
jgi:mRNA-degrading endonuclease RelE of RelBE toxin-antitoxin system